MKPLYVVAGPTACGKTAFAVKLAQKTDGEVVSADSMLVYRGMDIGTAKPTLAEREGVPHYMIDVAEPDEAFSAARYAEMAAAEISKIHERGKVPILTGGTGFYINAVVYGNDFNAADGAKVSASAEESEYREYLTQLARDRGAVYLHGLLRDADPDAAASIHPHNIKRVARALSFFRSTGKRISGHNERQRKNTPVYDARFIVLYAAERKIMYNRINERVTGMFEAGLAEEVRGLLDAGYHERLPSMQGIGYKETALYLRGGCTLEQAAETIRLNTRHYAKRQLTWFRHRLPGDAAWVDIANQLNF
ncbi:MAG: tRNA (adenosine(37)-N6)-dimethylallyltransferase MiaA [Clostridiales bacterium]|jgi:tRNA dimethylallyltransferase|nr:tRNA (adenosine(37)-N6)-dimethylallyltransferase MiaA [Clostridiales bacterium]